ncbi:MAG: signal transduction histidine kinase/CheY-like chemotaxis protein [Gammaproteobacteria bacterium]
MLAELRLVTQKSSWVMNLAWVLPTIISIIMVEITRLLGIALPVPFFIIIICVVIAGSIGGRRAGFIAGIIASLYLFRAYPFEFGPATLSGGLTQTIAGAVLFILIGTLLGRLRDQLNANIISLRDVEQRFQASLREETAEKDAQADKVAESEARLDAAIRIAGIGYFSFDIGSGDCIFCSEQHAAHLGLTPDEFRAGTAGPELQLFYIHADDRGRVIDALARIYAGENQTVEYRTVHPNGEVRYIREFEEPVFDEYGKVVANVGTSIDMTELREAEIVARQSQRTETIGALTGGVAHDFNNILAIILGNLELSQETDSPEDMRDLIENSIKATKRGADLTKSLLSFARRAPLKPARLNLNQTIQGTMTWATRVLPATIDIENALMADLWDVELDATSTENALINILLNARDAMPNGGKLTIETANMWIGDDFVYGRDDDIAPGFYVMLAISDTGHGISLDKFEKVFEPFYTEKPVGQGPGLGLSMVQGFIKQSGGAIRINSKVGVGTKFKLFFKATAQSSVKSSARTRAQRVLPSKQTEILVAEDQGEVMRVLDRILEDAGYSVTTASSGDEALKIFEKPNRFDLVLADIVMPGKLQGPALAKAIRLIDPDIPFVFLSSYAADAGAHDSVRPSDIRLMKPVSRHELLRAVSKALKSVDEYD